MKNNNAIPVVVALVIVFGVAGFAVFGLSPAFLMPRSAATPTPAPSSTTGTTTEPVSEADANPILPPDTVPAQKAQTDGSQTAMVYSVVTDDKGSRIEPHSITLPGKSDDPIAAALNAMVAEDKSPLPKGTVANSVTVAPDGLATVDFNKAFKDNFEGGDTKEALAINAVTATVGQFPGVKTVLITMDGEKMDSLGGTMSLDEPLPIPQKEGAKTTAQGK